MNQGDIFWVDLDEPVGSAPGYLRPVVIVQNDALNTGRIRTTIVCILTTNLKRAASPGNVLLEKGEANLPKQSVVNVSQIYTISKYALGEYVGTLSKKRVQQIVAGIQLLIEPVRL